MFVLTSLLNVTRAFGKSPCLDFFHFQRTGWWTGLVWLFNVHENVLGGLCSDRLSCGVRRSEPCITNVCNVVLERAERVDLYL